MSTAETGSSDCFGSGTKYLHSFGPTKSVSVPPSAISPDPVALHTQFRLWTLGELLNVRMKEAHSILLFYGRKKHRALC